ncbi:hypothetical protein Pint_36740 [Pistacia integerrima]|nr:hypothetical protein Pint_36740 [Pistacia integerrima]
MDLGQMATIHGDNTGDMCLHLPVIICEDSLIEGIRRNIIQSLFLLLGTLTSLIMSLALEEGAARKLNKRELLKHKSTEELPKSCCSIVKKSLFYAKLIIDPQGPCANEIALILYMTAAFLDPMFFYTRVINDDKRCISVEKSWGIAATLLRSVFDLFYIFHYTSTSGLINLYKTARIRFFMDLVVIFPLPQVWQFLLQLILICFHF